MPECGTIVARPAPFWRRFRLAFFLLLACALGTGAAFADIEARPTARLDRVSHVLLVQSMEPVSIPDVAPESPSDEPTPEELPDDE